METITTIADFETLLANDDAVLAYFSTETCSVCHVLKPKVADLVTKSFPLMKMVFIESDKPRLRDREVSIYKYFIYNTLLVNFSNA